MSVSPLSGTSNLLSRLALALRAGLAFRGARDYYTVFGYSRQVLPNDMVAKYYRQDVARRVVDTPCDAIWAYPPKIEGSAALMKLWEDLKRKKLLSAILQADKLCAFDSFSAIWIGTPEIGRAHV